MKIVVIGKGGQLAWEIGRLNSSENEIICLGRNEINLSCRSSVLNVLNSHSPRAVINAAAYTDVDLAETDKVNALSLNSVAVEILADVCDELFIHLIHVSTDFVFDGKKSTPYLPEDSIKPLGVYGESKAEGEMKIRNLLPDNSCIVRTSWLYSTHGNNFVKTMLRLMKDKTKLSVISDQIGSPTYAKGLAMACLYAATNKITGVHHWTDAGVASWYDFAVSIQEIAFEKKMLDTQIPIHPISTCDYPTPAKRPSYSVLDKTSLAKDFSKIPSLHWRTQLKTMLNELNTLKK